MGYTHYWKSDDVSADTWAKFIADVAKIINVSGPLANSFGDPGTVPEVTDTLVGLNGNGDDAYESFIIDQDYPGSGFCKTGNRPYDETVCAVLLAARHYQVVTSLSSDGTWADWKDGCDLYTKATGRRATRGSLTS